MKTLRRASRTHRGLAASTALALTVAQFALPQVAEAAPLGSSTASAGSASSPIATAIQSFQPDLFTGRATSAVPIAVPQGRKGLQPSLALAYASSNRNGWLGVGWSLDVGYIERFTKNGIPKYDGSDVFTFMFQGISSELVRIPDGTYRAEDEGLFLRFEDKGLSGWEVRDKSGTRYFFGQDVTSQIQDSGQVFRWALDAVRDANGNTLTITYTRDQQQLYLSRIRYTGHAPTGLAPTNQVDFILENRPDGETSYRSGFGFTTAKRLKAIETRVLVDDSLTLTRRYELAYTQSRRTGRSLLSSVTQIGADGVTSLPPSTFSYQDDEAPTYAITRNNPTMSSVTWNVRKAVMDLGHENFGCVDPYSGLPWSAPTVVSGSADLGCLSATVGSDGRVSLNGCQDHFGHAWIFLYANSPRTISVPLSSQEADACVFREDANGVQRVDSSSTVLESGWSVLHVTGYNQHTGWSSQLTSGLSSQAEILSPIQFLKPQLSGDVDGNGTSDLIAFDATKGTWTVSCARTCTLSPGGAWLSGFGSTSSIPLLGDWNSDGFTDIGIYSSGSWEFATSTGMSFERGAMSSLSFGSGTPLTGDFNGDGRMDLGTYDAHLWSVALATGDSFSSAGSFARTLGAGNNSTPLTGDFNGDGLTDIATVDQGTVSVALSNGSLFVSAQNPWLSGFGSGNYTSADVNGDGLTDVLSYDKGSGQVRYALSTGSQFGAVETLPVTFNLRAADDGIQVGDFNGDGLSDPAVFNAVTGNAELASSQGRAPDVLREIRNGVGGVTGLSYRSSGELGSPLPFIFPVVSQTTISDGLGHDYSTTYSYSGGRYDAPSKEFRGFARAEVRDAEANVAITEFHQDEHKKGRPFRTEFRDAFGNLWTKQEHVWSCLEPYPGVHFTKLDQSDAFTHDGDATFRQVRSTFAYDAHGNVVKTNQEGDVAVTGDERSTRTEFFYDIPSWLLNRPSKTQTLDIAGTVVAQRRFSYDGAGNLATEEEWINGPTGETWLTTSLIYDKYGNVITITDARGRTTTNGYDSSHTYLTDIRNALGHTRRLVYDPRFGQVTSSTDQNGVTTTTVYDALGRVVSVIGPNDTAVLPTIRYEYDLLMVPVRTTVHTRIESGQADELTAYSFADGLGRTVQTRSPAEDPSKQVVTGAVEYDVRGLVIKQWVPYLSSASSSYVPLNLQPTASNLAAVSYSYDPLGRLLTTTTADGSASSLSYDDWTLTSTNAKGQQTRRMSDAYGRLVQVEEFSANGGSASGGNDADIYTTMYTYDTLDNLIQVIDHAGNTSRIAYDSLGRKIAMDDPDMGHWTYAYDAVDNLVNQTDARGVVITFTYDPLNRLIRKEYADAPLISHLTPVTYTYDDPAKPFSLGKLTAIMDESGSSSFEYDNLGRLVKEEKVIDGTPYTVHRSYDLLGRLTALTYPDGETATYSYNAQGGLETIDLSHSLTSSPTHLITAIDYNAAGQLTTITYGNGVTTDYSYDPQTLRLSSLVTSHQTLATTLQDFSYSFDPLGNITAITDRVHTGSQIFGYDALNRLTKATGSYGIFTYAYDPIGNMIEKEGVTMRYGESGAGPHAVTSVGNGLGPGGAELSLAYDSNGNLVKKASPASGSELTAQLLRYDAENRLTEVATTQEETLSVTFHPGWNFFSLPVIPEDGSISVFFPSFTQDFEQIARLVPTSSLEPSAPPQFEHYVGNSKFDQFTQLEYGVGYQIYCKAAQPVTLAFKGKLPTERPSKSLPSGWHLLPAFSLEPRPSSDVFGNLNYDQLLAYDSAGQMLKPATQVEAGGAYYVHLRTAGTFRPALPRDLSTKFIYDGDGGRVKKITPSGTTTFLGQSFEKDPTGNTTKYIFAGSQRIAAISNGSTDQPANRQTVFYHGDHLGSSNVITDAQGGLTGVFEYTPYGSFAPTSHQPLVTSHYFTGQRLDDETGFYFYNARYYDPEIGRFISADTLVPDSSDPQAFNRYSYVRNNPIRFVDPSGHGWLKKFFKQSWESLKGYFHDPGDFFRRKVLDPLIAGGTALIFSGGNPIAAAAAITAHRVLDTGEGRQVIRRVGNEVFDDAFGLSPKVAYILSSVTLHAAATLAFESAFAHLSGASPASKVVDFDPENPEHAELLKSSGGYDPYGGRVPGGQYHDRPYFESNRLKVLYKNDKALAVVGKDQVGWRGVTTTIKGAPTHTGAIVEALSGRGIAPKFPMATFGTCAVCHQVTNATLLEGGFTDTAASLFPSWSTYSATVVYGNYGGQLPVHVYRAFNAADDNP